MIAPSDLFRRSYAVQAHGQNQKSPSEQTFHPHSYYVTVGIPTISLQLIKVDGQ